MNLISFLQRLPAARVRKTNDSLVAAGAKDPFNQMIRPYGRVLDFKLNTQERTVFASFRLKGEVDAIGTIWVAKSIVEVRSEELGKRGIGQRRSGGEPLWIVPKTTGRLSRRVPDRKSR